jgi:peptidoglycan/LPS O-acetylase OafA/YrhL
MHMTRARYATLDGLRGVAAFAVLLFHCIFIARPVVAVHGYLAVDFFFMLSGFVISHAYRQRLRGGMTIGAFFRQRATRLGPIVVAGVLLGAAYQLLGLELHPDSASGLDIVGRTLCNLVLIPAPFGRDPVLFPNNWALWSLFFEVLANLAWAVGFARARPAATYLFTAAAGLGLAAYGLVHGDLNAGWEWSTFGGGVLRVSFGFWCGCSLYLLRDRLAGLPRAPGWVAFVIVAGILAAPFHNGALEALLVLAAFPVALVLAITQEPPPALDRVYALAGEISYPLYGLHLPALLMLVGVLRAVAPQLIDTPAAFAVVPVLLGLGWLGTVFYERPALAFLKRRGRRPAAAAQTATI